jgi:hypothetical protein
MATVSYTVIATGTIDPTYPTRDPEHGGKTFIWDRGGGMPQTDAVHMFWVSMQPVPPTEGGVTQSWAWITQAEQQTYLFGDTRVDRRAVVSFDYFTTWKANFSVLAATVTP